MPRYEKNNTEFSAFLVCIISVLLKESFAFRCMFDVIIGNVGMFFSFDKNSSDLSNVKINLAISKFIMISI